jgi:hypothetical protein
MVRLVTLIALVVSAAGCKTANPESCELPENKDQPACSNVDAPVDGAFCDDTHTCSSGVCSAGECVECIRNMDCADVATPTCDTTAHTCRACAAHRDCDSQACLPSGVCVPEGNVAYVANPGGGTDCTKAAPCATLNAAVAKSTTHIKIQGTMPISDSILSTIASKAVTILADPGAKLQRSTQGPILEVQGDNADVTIYDLQIREGLGTSGDGVVLSGGNARLTLERVALIGNGGRGVFSASGGKLTMRQCIVSTNTLGGGNIQNIEVEMTNNIIVANGGGGSSTGGLTLAPNVGSVFQYNTVSDNVSSLATDATRGINCVVAFLADSNIVTGNKLGPGCTFNSSLFDATVLGTGNRIGDPKFKNIDTNNPTGNEFYRINAGSMAIDGGEASGVTIDIDGEPRPQGTQNDMGADELP